jgi:hypothetical protein
MRIHTNTIQHAEQTSDEMLRSAVRHYVPMLTGNERLEQAREGDDHNAVMGIRSTLEEEERREQGRGASVVERAKVAAHGYVVERYGKGWVLKDPDGAELMIGDHGCVAPTRWECIAEAVARIEQDERLAARTRDCDDPTCPDCGKPIEKNTRSGQGIWNHVGLPGECWRISLDGPDDNNDKASI